jgi:hypothetical protein
MLAPYNDRQDLTASDAYIVPLAVPPKVCLTIAYLLAVGDVTRLCLRLEILGVG